MRADIFLGTRDIDYQDTSEAHFLRPIDFLRLILKSDRELNETFLKWMADIMDYRRQSGKYMEELEATVKEWRNQSN
jgi:hypothetical protein